MKMTQPLKTHSDMLASLGPPDQDQDIGVIGHTPEKDGNPNQVQAYRTLHYNNLSDTANVVVYVYPAEQVYFILTGNTSVKEKGQAK